MKTIRQLLFLAIAWATFTSAAHAGTRHPERWYQVRWCEAHHGQIEYVLPDRTRCDCLTDTHAVEVDFARKWTEAIGQALYYSAQTGKRAGLVLILETRQDQKYWDRLTKTIAHFRLPIDVWMIPQVIF